MARKLNSLFKPTEPKAAPEAAAAPSIVATSEPEAAGNPFDMVPLPGFEGIPQPKQEKKLKPQSVYLTKSELAYIQDIADAYGESRHAVLQYAVKELIRQWKRGKKPRTNNLGKLDK